MTLLDRPSRLLAFALAALAGLVDATGFQHLGGFFVSFMSGNSTRLGVGLNQPGYDAVRAGMLISGFLAGVMVGSLCGHHASRRRKPVVLALVAALLAVAAGLGHLEASWSASVIMASAMGAENAVFERDDDIPFGVTYMTGALVKTGQRLAKALRGGDPLAWVPYALLWLALTSGAAIGAAAFPYLGLSLLWLVAAAFAGLAAAAALTPPPSATH